MTRIAFVACSKTKDAVAAPAAALYTSALFRKSLLAAIGDSKKVYILSAKHGVLPLDQVIEPYDLTLRNMSRDDRTAWAQSAVAQLQKVLKAGDVANFYCGEEYTAPLRRTIAQLGCRMVEPLFGIPFGKRLQRLQTINDEQALHVAHKRFYRVMRGLYEAQDGGRRIRECSGKMSWPERGVYFIIEDHPASTRNQVPRITRVGTHAVSTGSRTSLWDRVSTHRGTGRGTGSHRSSIFRLHIGRALMNLHHTGNWPDSWSKGQTASASVRDAETSLERLVSSTIGDMRLLWLNVPDTAGPASDRAYIERNAIGLLSRSVLLSPILKRSWLGKSSADWRIAVSGLWNLDHLFIRPDPVFLDVLQSYVDVTLGRRPEPKNSLAPQNWRLQESGVTESTQLSLFAAQIDGHV
jgi:hypothetical protein